jgi:beta-galactosidase GanA
VVPLRDEQVGSEEKETRTSKTGEGDDGRSESEMIFGTQYYRPPFPGRELWDRDLDKILATGFNTIKVWSVWSWNERQQGVFYFDDLDELMELCGRKGLQVVINLVPEGAPYWVQREHPDARYKTHDGYPLEFSGAANLPSGGWPGLCRDKPEVEYLANRFLATTAKRYASQPHLLALDVWNEPHIDPSFDYPNKIFCYCDHSQRKFTDWLKRKYGTLEVLNGKWHRGYGVWDDVTAPTRFGTYPDMIDWRLFWLENHASWLGSRIEAVKSVAQTKRVMTHVPFSGYIGSEKKGDLGQTLTDEFLLANKVEKFGLTSFPKWLMDNDFVQHALNVELVAAACQEKEFWQSELQSGGGLWGVRGSGVANPDEIRLWNWTALAAGAKGIMYWQWRPEPSGLEAPGFGLTTLDGDLSARTEAAAEVASRVSADGRLSAARRLLPVNGIYVSRHSALLAFAASRADEIYAKALYGSYRAFFEQNVPVRFVHADDLVRAIREGLETLYLPAALSISDREEEELASFVEKGGTLVSEACPGLFDERGVLKQSGTLLHRVLGLGQQVVDRAEKVELIWKPEHAGSLDTSFCGSLYRHTVNHLESDVEVLACFVDGTPAMCRRPFGEGVGIWIGTFLSLAVEADLDSRSIRGITRWSIAGGYPEIAAIKASKPVLLRAHRTSNGELVCVAVNYGRENTELKIQYVDRAGSSEEPTTRELAVELEARDGKIIGLGNSESRQGS